MKAFEGGNKMNKDNVLNKYLEIVPEVQERFKKQCKKSLIDDTDGAHVIWSLGLIPCVIELIKDNKKNESILQRTFTFFEKMASSDEEVRELLLYSVLEKLGDDKEILNISMTLMGKNTLKLSQQVENFLGR